MESNTEQTKMNSRASKRVILLFGIAGILAIGASLVWNIKLDRDTSIEELRVQARSAFEKDVLYRRWIASHGGVYVHPDEQTPPNPHLDFLPERDITTTDGQRLTLVNPAYMTRQVFELGNETNGVLSHITSLKPIRPENAADPWETAALKAFENGSEEVSSIDTLNGREYLRLMKPLITEKPCLKCHKRQGYKLGDIRGGISVSIPMEKPCKAMTLQRNKVIFTHLILFLFGGISIYFGAIFLGRNEKQLSQAMKNLRKSHLLLSESQKIARLGSYSLDITTGVWTSSEVLDEIFGIDNDYVKNIEGWSRIIHPDDRDEMLNYFNQKIIAEHHSFDREYRIITIRGQQEKWVHGIGKLELNDQGEPVRMTGSVQDITERKTTQIKLNQAAELDKQRLKTLRESLEDARKAQKASFNLTEDLMREIDQRKNIEADLKTAREYSQNIIKSSLDMIIAVDTNRQITEFNRAAEETFGYKRDMVLKEHIDLLYADIKQGETVHKITIEKSRHVQEILNKRANGEVFPALLASSTLVNANGEIIGVMGVSRDITEQKRNRKKLELALHEAQQGERVKSFFLANMSHEIRTPLNAIIGFTDLIAASTRHLVNDEEKEFFDAVSSSGKRLMHTVHEILDISQIEAGTYELKMEVFDLVELVNEFVREYSLPARNKGLKLIYQSPENPAFIQADRQSISQALDNILDNAVKYTEKGEVTVTLKWESRHIILTIQDTGIGIAEEYLDDLFEAFTQESEGYTKKFQGIGLGMAITKRHLDLNQVDIAVDSAKGAGATFTLTFKAVDKPTAQDLPEKEKTAPTEKPREKPSILLVEDDVNSQKLTGYFLKGKYDLITAVSVHGAKNQLKAHAVDLILLDLSLAGNEDGLDLARYLRGTAGWKNIPIIALTAHAFNKDRDRCIAAGCNDYLTKPVKKETMLEKIKRYI